MAKLVFKINNSQATIKLKNDNGTEIFSCTDSLSSFRGRGGGLIKSHEINDHEFSSSDLNNKIKFCVTNEHDSLYMVHTYQQDDIEYTAEYYFIISDYIALKNAVTNNSNFNTSEDIEWTSVEAPHVCSFIESHYPSELLSADKDKAVINIRVWLVDKISSFNNTIYWYNGDSINLRAIYDRNGNHTGYYETGPTAFVYDYNNDINNNESINSKLDSDTDVISNVISKYIIKSSTIILQSLLSYKIYSFVFMQLFNNENNNDYKSYRSVTYNAFDQVLFNPTENVINSCNSFYIYRNNNRVKCTTDITQNIAWWHNENTNSSYRSGVLSACDPGNYPSFHVFSTTATPESDSSYLGSEITVYGFIGGNGVISHDGTTILSFNDNYPTIVEDRVYDGQDTFSFSGASSPSVGSVGTLTNINPTHNNINVVANCKLNDVTVPTNNEARIVTITYTVEGADAEYYTAPKTEYIIINITPAPLTITGTKLVDKYYDTNRTANVDLGTISGVLSGDDVVVNVYKYDTTPNSTNPVVFDNESVGTYNVNVKYVLTGDDAKNYYVAYSSGNYDTISGEIMSFTINADVVAVAYKEGN